MSNDVKENSEYLRCNWALIHGPMSLQARASEATQSGLGDIIGEYLIIGRRAGP